MSIDESLLGWIDLKLLRRNFLSVRRREIQVAECGESILPVHRAQLSTKNFCTMIVER